MSRTDLCGRKALMLPMRRVPLPSTTLFRHHTPPNPVPPPAPLLGEGSLAAFYHTEKPNPVPTYSSRLPFQRQLLMNPVQYTHTH